MHLGFMLHEKPEASVPSTLESSAMAGLCSPQGVSSQLNRTSGQRSITEKAGNSGSWRQISAEEVVWAWTLDIKLTSHHPFCICFKWCQKIFIAWSYIVIALVTPYTKPQINQERDLDTACCNTTFTQKRWKHLGSATSFFNLWNSLGLASVSIHAKHSVYHCLSTCHPCMRLYNVLWAICVIKHAY